MKTNRRVGNKKIQRKKYVFFSGSKIYKYNELHNYLYDLWLIFQKRMNQIHFLHRLHKKY